MEVQINWLAVLLAGLSSMVVGSIYYAKPVFGSLWIKLAKIDERRLKEGGVKPIVLAVLASLVTAFVLAHITYIASVFYLDVSFMAVALTTAFWLWLGISATTIVIHDVFEHRPTKLTFLTAGYQLFSLLVMAVIIGLLKP